MHPTAQCYRWRSGGRNCSDCDGWGLKCITTSEMRIHFPLLNVFFFPMVLFKKRPEINASGRLLDCCPHLLSPFPSNLNITSHAADCYFPEPLGCSTRAASCFELSFLAHGGAEPNWKEFDTKRPSRNWIEPTSVLSGLLIRCWKLLFSWDGRLKRREGSLGKPTQPVPGRWWCMSSVSQNHACWKYSCQAESPYI